MQTKAKVWLIRALQVFAYGRLKYSVYMWGGPLLCVHLQQVSLSNGLTVLTMLMLLIKDSENTLKLTIFMEICALVKKSQNQITMRTPSSEN